MTDTNRTTPDTDTRAAAEGFVKLCVSADNLTLRTEATVPGLAQAAEVRVEPDVVALTMHPTPEERTRAMALLARVFDDAPREASIPVDTVRALLTSDAMPGDFGLSSSAVANALHAVRLAVDAGVRGDVVNRDVAEARLANMHGGATFTGLHNNLRALVRYAREAQVEAPGELPMGEAARLYASTKAILDRVEHVVSGRTDILRFAAEAQTTAERRLGAIMLALHIGLNPDTSSIERRTLGELAHAAPTDESVRWCLNLVRELDGVRAARDGAETAARQASLALTAEAEAHTRSKANAEEGARALTAEVASLTEELGSYRTREESHEREVEALRATLARNRDAAAEREAELTADLATVKDLSERTARSLAEEAQEHATTRAAYALRMEEYTALEQRAREATAAAKVWEETCTRIANDHAAEESELRRKLDAALDSMSRAAAEAQERTATLDALTSIAAARAARFPAEDLTTYIQRALTADRSDAVLSSAPAAAPAEPEAPVHPIGDVFVIEETEIPGQGEPMRPSDLLPETAEPAAAPPPTGANEPDPWATRRRAPEPHADVQAPPSLPPPPAAIVTPPPAPPPADAAPAPSALTAEETAALTSVAGVRYLKDVVGGLHALFPAWNAARISEFVTANSAAIAVARRIPSLMLPDRVLSTCVALRID